MKTISDNEIIETSRGKKRIGSLFDENAMLSAENAELKDLCIKLNDELFEIKLCHKVIKDKLNMIISDDDFMLSKIVGSGYTAKDI